MKTQQARIEGLSDYRTLEILNASLRSDKRTLKNKLQDCQSQRDELADALKMCLDVMERVHGISLPIHLGGYCEEQDWSTAVRTARSEVAQWEADKKD